MKWSKVLYPVSWKSNSDFSKSSVSKGERKLGTDPETGKPVIVRMGRFGAIVQIGETDSNEKPKYASRQRANINQLPLKKHWHFLNFQE